MARVVVGLGSNLGDRRQSLASARAAITLLDGVSDVRASALYETKPVGGPPQGDYLNAALAMTWPDDRDPHALLSALLGIERDLGRERRERWGPRTIDLDVLFIDGVVIDSPALVVPHPRLFERAFALVPLLEVAPDARHPITHAPLAEVCRALGRERLSRADAGPW